MKGALAEARRLQRATGVAHYVHRSPGGAWEVAAWPKAGVVPQRPAVDAPGWWLTFGHGRCDECGHSVHGSEVAYRQEDRRTLCKVCWEREGIMPTPSRRWLAAKGKAKKRRRKHLSSM